jgi:hypothetical protein
MEEEKQRKDEALGKLTVGMAPIILQAEKELLSPDHFYRLCKNASQFSGAEKLYFYQPEQYLWDLEKGIGSSDLLVFFDYLSTQLRNPKQSPNSFVFYLSKDSNSNLLIQQDGKEETDLKVTVEVVGQGMIGRVAKVTINGQYLAFKTFFDPQFVWQHGVWAETAIGIYLKANNVTKNIAEFQFGGEDWSVWEWIDPDLNPSQRKGITYEELAEQKALTKLNSLNIQNYNLQGVRLDVGGVQKECRGRRLDNFRRAIIFYLRKVQKEGLLSLAVYLKKDNIIYGIKRLIALIFPKLYGNHCAIKSR